MSSVINGPLTGFRPMAPYSAWNTPIINNSIDPNSSSIISAIGGSTPLHPDFGSGYIPGQTKNGLWGLVYVVVDPTDDLISYKVGIYASESDIVPALKLPNTAQIIEGWPQFPPTDQKVIALYPDKGLLLELSITSLVGSGASAYFQCDAAAVWNMYGPDYQRKYNYTSANAAGFPILPGLVKYEEASRGYINHALTYTLDTNNIDTTWIPPASHTDGHGSGGTAAPMGTRLRLKSSVDISSYSYINQVILTALKVYGMILTDSGGALYLDGCYNPNWNNSDINNLTAITLSDFEVMPTYPRFDYHTVPQFNV